MLLVLEMVKLCIQQSFFPVFEINSDEYAAHSNENLTLLEVLAGGGRKDNLEQVLEFREFSCLK